MTRIHILHHWVLTTFLTKLFQDSQFAFHADSGLSYTGDQATQSYLESWQTIKEWKINYLSVFIPLFFTRACQNSWLEKPWNNSRLLPKNIVQSISFQLQLEWIIIIEKSCEKKTANWWIERQARICSDRSNKCAAGEKT